MVPHGNLTLKERDEVFILTAQSNDHHVQEVLMGEE
jgi:hypothetical protein